MMKVNRGLIINSLANLFTNNNVFFRKNKVVIIKDIFVKVNGVDTMSYQVEDKCKDIEVPESTYIFYGIYLDKTGIMYISHCNLNNDELTRFGTLVTYSANTMNLDVFNSDNLIYKLSSKETRLFRSKSTYIIPKRKY